MLPATYIIVYVFYMSFVLLQTQREAFVKIASVTNARLKFLLHFGGEGG